MTTHHRIGIIGVGAIAEVHALAVRDTPGAELVAACCRTEAKGRAFCEKYGGDWFASAEALIETAKPDVVCVCTPSGAHLEPTVAALQHGVHVLCEKPLEIDLDRARRMIAAEQASTARLGGVFPQRFNPVVSTAHAAAAAGRLGNLAVASAYVPWWRDDAYYAPSRWQGTMRLDGGGALINQAIHAVDAMQWLAAAAGAGPAVEAFGYTAQRGHAEGAIEVEDTAVASIRFESGALGLVLASTAMWPGGAMRMHAGGRDGTIEIHEEELVTWRFREELPEDEATRTRFGDARGAGGGADPMAINYSNHTRNLADFLSAIDEGRPSLIGAAEACKSLAIIRAIYASAESGRPVAIEAIA
ncbi:putative oxidoreductase YcjS [Pirellulimonas nuda]|uniref:Putative oxidoreductase YcjS n=1 Tax=Pirellulimonas nuda TaxID=2528009 RepID=A0A518D9T7_9BACT|nr:Gfo/Idh/MocA family oxidoreductase [Pirellulimonas nuda]QDU88250.1 putative oxidoreductase YcjS [Pirellulimonas nuda]